MLGIGIGFAGIRRAGAAAFPQSLFGASDNGAIYDPSQTATIFRTHTLSRASREHVLAKALQDVSGKGSNATNATASTSPRYIKDVTSGKRAVWFKQGFDSITATFSGSLGSSATVVRAHATGVEFLTGQTIGTTLSIAKTFFWMLVINRALTAPETAAVLAYASAFCPNYKSTDYTYFVDSTRADDTGNGLTLATAKKTLDAGYTLLLAGADGASLAIYPGTYADAFNAAAGTGLTGKTHSIYCPLAGVVLDGGQTPPSSASAFNVAFSSVYTCNIYGNNNLTIQNWGNNGLGTDTFGNGGLYDALVTNCDDGASSHTTSTSRRYRLTITNCTKGAFTDTGASATTYNENCAFYGRLGATTVGVGLFGEKGVTFTHYGCDYLPDPATTSTWTAYFAAATGAGSGIGTTRLIQFGRFGAPHITPGTISLSSMFNTTIEDSYLRGWSLQLGVVTAVMNLTRCYGVYTLRLRGAVGAAVITEDHCVVTSGSAHGSDRHVNGDFYSGPTDVFGTIVVKNTIMRDCATAIFATSNTTEFNTSASLLNNLFYNNTTNMTVGITADGTDVTAQDPLLVDPTTDAQDDYVVTAGSPSLGAGVAGTNIGLGLTV